MTTAFTFETAKIVGNPYGHCWSQIHTFSSEDPDKKQKRGDLIAALIIKGAPEGIAAVSLGREILGRLHEEYYGNIEGSAFSRLSESVQKVCLEHEGTEIIAGVLLGEVLYLVVKGEGKVLLKRGDNIGILLSGDDMLKTASGYIKSGDVIVLGSGHFFRIVGSGVIKSALETSSPSEAEENLAPMILGKDDMADAACVIVLLKKEEEDLVMKNTVNLQQADPVTEPEIEKKKGHLEIKEKLNKIKFFKPRTIRVRGEGPGRNKKILYYICLSILVILGIYFGISFLGKKTGLDKNKALTPEVETLNGNNFKEEVKPGTIYELNQISENANGVKICLAGSKLAVLDNDNKKVYLYDLTKKEVKTIDLTDFIRLTSCSENKLYLFGGKGIFVVELNTDTLSLKIPSDVVWEDIVAIDSFGNNLYLLDSRNLEIWRFVAKNDVFSNKTGWFSQKPELNNVISFAIDGSVWMLTKDGIFKYVLGKKDQFTIKNFNESFLEPNKIVTSENDNSLYVLDKGRKEIMVFDKNGEFKKAYYWDGLSQVNDFTVSEQKEKIYLVGEQKIFEIGTK